MSDEAAEALFFKLNGILREQGLLIRDLVIGAVRYSVFPRTVEQLGFLVIGLEALAASRKPKDRDGRKIVHHAA